MRRKFSFSILAVAMLVGGCVTTPALRAPPPVQPDPKDKIPGEYIITLQPGADPGRIEAIYRDLGVSGVQDLGRGRYLIRLAKDPGTDAVLDTGYAAGAVEAAQPNYARDTARPTPP